MGDAVTEIATNDFNRPQPHDMTKCLGEVLFERLIPWSWDCTHGRHDDDVESNPDKQTKGSALPELDLRVLLSNQAVKNCKEDGKSEVDDERDDRKIVAVESDRGVHEVGGEPQLLQEFLGRIGGIAFRRAWREWNFPAE